MAATEVKVRMQQRRDTAAGWTSANPVLLNGELGFETDTKKAKLGDGTAAWNSLSYLPGFAISAYPLATADIADDAITAAKLADTAVTAGSYTAADITVDAQGRITAAANGAIGTSEITDGAVTSAKLDTNITIAGDLTVNGTTTTINSTTLTVDDKNIELGSVATPTDVTADGGGITLKGATDKTLTWVNSTDCWTFNQSLNLPAGSASAPALILNGDTNTGIYSPGTDQVAISTNGTGRLFVDGSGNVGVGAAPTTRLEVARLGAAWTGVAPVAGTTLFVHNGSAITTSPARLSILSGNAADAAIYFGDTDNNNEAIIQLDNTDDSLQFYVDGSERLRITSIGQLSHIGGGSTGSPAVGFNGSAPSNSLVIDSTGKVGLGTSSADELLHIQGDTAEFKGTNTNPIADAAGTEQVFKFGIEGQKNNVYGPAGSIIFRQDDSTWSAVDADLKPTRIEFCTQDGTASDTSETPRLVIDSSGNVGVGAAPTTRLEVARLGATWTGDAPIAGTALFVHNGNNLSSSPANIQISTGNAASGRIYFGDSDNATKGLIEYDHADDHLHLSTNGSERARINAAGELLVGYTSDNGTYKLQVNSQIFATSATIATSDGRYKENVATLDGCVDLVKALRPVSFDWKHQEPITRIDEEGETVVVREAHNFPDGTQVGFIAQEVETVLADKPWLSSVIKQNVRPAVTDNDGNELAPEEEFLGIAEGNLVAVLTSALQEAIAKIETLEAKVAALEAG